jgi:hypothetical protein
MRNSSEKRGFSYSCGVFGKAEKQILFERKILAVLNRAY